MNKKTQEETREIVETLQDDAIQAKVTSISNIDPVDSLKLAIFDFFKARLNTIESDNELQSLVEEKLRAEIEEGNLTVTQLIGLQKSLKAETTIATSSILEILKPVPNASSFMDTTKPEKSSVGTFEGISDAEDSTLKKLTNLILSIKQKEASEEEKK